MGTSLCPRNVFGPHIVRLTTGVLSTTTTEQVYVFEPRHSEAKPSTAFSITAAVLESISLDTAMR